MAKLITCLALATFSRFVDGHGIVHGDPDSSLDEARNPQVPEAAVATLVGEGLIAAPEGFGEAAAEDEKPTKIAKGAKVDESGAPA